MLKRRSCDILYKYASIPSIKLQLIDDNNYNSLTHAYYNYTTSNDKVYAVCKECGRVFIGKKNYRTKTREFCSVQCNTKHLHKKRTENAFKLAFMILTKEDIKYFYNKYNSFAMSEIYKYPKYHEDLIEWWQTKGVFLARFLKQTGRLKVCKDFNLISKNIKWFYLHLLKDRENEIFYDECSYKTQNYILGSNNLKD